MRQEEACLGMFVRLLSDWHGIPKDTVGSIDRVETELNGSWWFTIFWELHRPLPSTMPGRSLRRTGLQSGSLGLRLWEEDLPRFETITQEQKAAAALPTAPPADTSPTLLCLFGSEAAAQLTLPFMDQELGTIRELIKGDQPQVTIASVAA